MGFLLESLSMLCSCVPLIDKQAIEDPIHIPVMKLIRLTEDPLLSCHTYWAFPLSHSLY